MMPFAAQGAAMAIEDAFELANRLAARARSHEALLAFEAQRAPRVAKVRERGAFNRFAYHARGPIRSSGATSFCRCVRRKRLAADLDWLYGYDAEYAS